MFLCVILCYFVSFLLMEILKSFFQIVYRLIC